MYLWLSVVVSSVPNSLPTTFTAANTATTSVRTPPPLPPCAYVSAVMPAGSTQRRRPETTQQKYCARIGQRITRAPPAEKTCRWLPSVYRAIPTVTTFSWRTGTRASRKLTRNIIIVRSPSPLLAAFRFCLQRTLHRYRFGRRVGGVSGGVAHTLFRQR